MNREDLEKWLVSRKWEKDSFGHYKRKSCSRDGDIREYRYKLSKTSFRYEVKGEFGWVRLRSAYYKNARITEDNKLAGLKI